ncbi:MAG: protein-disulfide reductase DsbD family protein [Planctomycetaceae bacterium]
MQQSPSWFGPKSAESLPLAVKLGDIETLIATLEQQILPEGFDSALRDQLILKLKTADLNQAEGRELIVSTRDYLNGKLSSRLFVPFVNNITKTTVNETRRVDLADRWLTATDDGSANNVTAKAYLSANRLTAGGTVRVAVVLDIDEGYHLNANPNPDYDFLILTTLTLESEHQTTLSAIEYPKGQEYKIDGFDDPFLIYRDRVVIIGTLIIPTESSQEFVELSLYVKIQCSDDASCYQPEDIKLTLRAFVEPEGVPVTAINRDVFTGLK